MEPPSAAQHVVGRGGSGSFRDPQSGSQWVELKYLCSGAVGCDALRDSCRGDAPAVGTATVVFWQMG